jgi:hypothetical protein
MVTRTSAIESEHLRKALIVTHKTLGLSPPANYTDRATTACRRS